MYDAPTYFAWFVLALLFGLAVAFIVWVGSRPKAIAEKRNHPQVDSINALAWFGLLFGGVGWVIAFVWALLRAGPLGTHAASDSIAPLNPNSDKRIDELTHENRSLKARVAELESKLSKTKGAEKET